MGNTPSDREGKSFRFLPGETFNVNCSGAYEVWLGQILTERHIRAMEPIYTNTWFAKVVGVARQLWKGTKIKIIVTSKSYSRHGLVL